MRRIRYAYPRAPPEPEEWRPAEEEARMFTGIVEELGEVVALEDLGDAPG